MLLQTDNMMMHMKFNINYFQLYLSFPLLLHLCVFEAGCLIRETNHFAALLRKFYLGLRFKILFQANSAAPFQHPSMTLQHNILLLFLFHQTV